MVHGEAASSPDTNRISECLCLRLFREFRFHTKRLTRSDGRSMSITQSIVEAYGHIRQLLLDNELVMEQTSLVLVTISNTTVAKW